MMYFHSAFSGTSMLDTHFFNVLTLFGSPIYHNLVIDNVIYLTLLFISLFVIFLTTYSIQESVTYRGSA